MQSDEVVIAQTRKWILDVVVGCNFCPFAAREMKEGRVFYEVLAGTGFPFVKPRLLNFLKAMDKEESIETLFLIFTQSSFTFSAYLALVKASERALKKEGYEGRYQIASFHPEYLFAGSDESDPANYTNRSPYAMMQVLREKSLSRVIDRYPDTLSIPENNIAYTREKGLAHLQALREACFDINS
jgi:hypothetical protein